MRGVLVILAVSAPAAIPAALDAQLERKPGVGARGVRCSPGAVAWWTQTAGSGRHGRIVCAADPARPAVLLFHGGLGDARAWTEPSHTELAYDYARAPARKQIGTTHAEGNNGLYEVGRSAWLYGNDRSGWDRRNNWFQFLEKQGYTVATWSQDAIVVSDAMQSARAAFDSFLVQTAARSPAAPPPVALIGHGKGGLLIRQLLKEKGSMGRVKWVVTLHSPHTGSEVAASPTRIAAEIADVIDCCTPALITGPDRQRLKEMAVDAARPLIGSMMADESRELRPDSPLYRALVQGEKRLDDVAYHTFGGTNPQLFRLYAWLFEAGSAKPQYTESSAQYFVWWVKSVEVSGVSPLLEKIRDFAPEVSPEAGDGLVADVRSRLPWSIHTTTALNHAELLWNLPLMQRVSGLIAKPVASNPGRMGDPPPVRTNPVRRNR